MICKMTILIENFENIIHNVKRKMIDILYNETFDNFELKKRKKIDILYNKMIDFLNHLLKIIRIVFANIR